MLPHCWEGTQRLELPVSRTTLKLWGGVPTVISEKSRRGSESASVERRVARLTLSVHEVGNGHRVRAISMNDLGVEDVVCASVGAGGAHVFLTEALDVRLDIGGGLSLNRQLSATSAASTGTSSYQLLSKRHLLELHLVDSGLGRAKQRSCGENSALHDGRRVRRSTSDRSIDKAARIRSA